MPRWFSSIQTLSTVVLDSRSTFSNIEWTMTPTISSDLSGESILPRTCTASSHPSLATVLPSTLSSKWSTSASAFA